MFSLSIIIHFDVFNDTRFWHAPNHIPLLANKRDFQDSKEALRDRLIVAVCSAPHASVPQTILPNQLLITLGTILAANGDRVLGKAAAEQGHGGCITHQLLHYPSVR